MKKTEIFEQVSQLLESQGLTLSDYIREVGVSNSSLLDLPAEVQVRFDWYYDQLKNGKVPQNEKGKMLEELTFLLFDCNLFSVYRNCHTSTNEIDILVDWSEKARLSGVNTAYPCFGDRILCECKNYSKPVGVTYIGKFASLLATTNANIGIMISWSGVTGTGWRDGLGLIKKVALSEKHKIIVIEEDDLRMIRNKTSNLFKIVHKKSLALDSDLNYQRYIQRHSAENELSV